MKKYFIASSLILSSLTTPLFAEESKSFYLSVGGGVGFTSDVEGDYEGVDAKFDTNTPFQYSFAVGKEFDDWRLEFNYSASTVSSDSLTVTVGGNGVTADIAPDLELETKSFMLYGIKDIPSDTNFTPYLGAGLGFSSLSTDAATYNIGGNNVALTDFDKSVFTFGVKGGVEYEIAENTSLYSEVSYLNLASFSTEAGENYDSNSTIGVSAGLRFSF